MPTTKATFKQVRETSTHNILLLRIKDRGSLYAAYMPFLKNGGLFVPTSKHYRIEDDAFILLDLLEEPEEIPVVGKVVWVTPAHAQNNRVCGLGIEFNKEDSAFLRHKIETYLADYVPQQKQTHTL